MIYNGVISMGNEVKWSDFDGSLVSELWSCALICTYNVFTNPHLVL